MKSYRKLAIDDPAHLEFGVAPHPLTTRDGMVIGGGTVYPELNFTLPPMLVEEGTMPEVRRNYREIIIGAVDRAVELESPGLVIELETLPPMVEQPHWGTELVAILLEGLALGRERHGLKSVLRMTPNDIREFRRPPLLRQGDLLERMLSSFEQAARAGAELLSIESVGGKEICDEALTMADLRGVLFGLVTLGARDMEFLWTEIDAIARRHGAHAAGDTACGFANTAMVLADKNYIPKTFAAIVRVMSAVRSLVAYSCGAVGPGKDCGYENVFLKAITGRPMAMEGKTAACAHLSALGNIAAAACDTWSNESVQNVRLLAAMAPTCYLEQLIYDCRLMNTARESGESGARQLRDWMVKSDAGRDPQAWILAPDNAVAIARAIVDAPDNYTAARHACLRALDLIVAGVDRGQLKLAPRERPWIDRIRSTLEALPEREGDFIAEMLDEIPAGKFIPAEYGL